MAAEKNAFDANAPWVKNLVDPDTRKPLVYADAKLLAKLRASIASGRLTRKDGEPPPTEFEGAFLSKDHHHAYLVIDGIPNFLIDERIDLGGVVLTATKDSEGARRRGSAPEERPGSCRPSAVRTCASKSAPGEARAPSKSPFP